MIMSAQVADCLTGLAENMWLGICKAVPQASKANQDLDKCVDKYSGDGAVFTPFSHFVSVLHAPFH